MTFFENIHFYTYNNSAKKLIASIKKYANKMDFYALKLLIENYFKIDPFNQLKYLQQFIKTLVLQEIAIKIIITPIPNSPTGLNKRGFNFSEILAKNFSELLQNYLKDPEETVQIANIFRNIGKTSQKEQKSRLSRVLHAYSSLYLLNAKCLEILRHTRKNATKPTETIFIILDDIATTNTTILSAAEQLIRCIKLFKKLESLPISSSINTFPNPQHIRHSNRLSRIQFNQKNKNFIHVLTITIFKKEKERQYYASDSL